MGLLPQEVEKPVNRVIFRYASSEQLPGENKFLASKCLASSQQITDWQIGR
jgi:hypothetical protein